MAEFLRNRRYCRFRDRKSRRSKMNVDNAVDFKVKRFIQDVDKYLEKAKKKKELKEIKRKEDNFTVKRGFYKSAVLSHAGRKAFLNGSNNARLKGDLIDLSKKHQSKKKTASEILSQEGEKPREPSSSQKRVEEKYSTVACNEVFDDITELENLPVENKTSEQITQVTCAQNENTPSKRYNQVIQENLNPGGFFSDVENPFREIAVTDVLQNASQNENCKQIFNEEPANTKGEFFDFLSKTPGKANNSSFKTVIKPIDSPKWEQYQQNFKISSLKIRRPEISRTQPILPEDYIFKFNTQKNEYSNQFDLFKGNNKEQKKTFDLSQEYFKSDIGSPKFKHSFVKSCFSSDRLLPTNNYYPLDISGLGQQPIQEISSVTKYWPGNSPVFKKSNSYFNRRARMKTSFSFSRQNRSRGHDNKESVFVIPKANKHFEKDQFYQRKRIKNKNEQLFNKNHSLLCSNNRFKTSLKFSPHKYC